MARRIDNLGRLVIPKDIRKKLSLDVGSEVTFTLCDGAVIITPTRLTCKMCGTTCSVSEEVGVCEECLKKIRSAGDT